MIGVLVALALIAGAAILLFRKRKTVPAPPEQAEEAGATPICETDAGNVIHEKDPGGDKSDGRMHLGRMQSELSGSEVGHELESPPARAELEGDGWEDGRSYR